MVSLNLADFLLAPFACAAISSLVGIKTAWWRSRGRSQAWAALDVLVLLPALLPAHPLAKVLKNLFGEPPGPIPELWPVLATIVVSTPFAYLPARLAFARIDRQLRESPRLAGSNIFQRVFRVEIPRAWPALVLAVLLATARTFNEYATEIFADVPALIAVTIPMLAAAILIARSIAHGTSKS